MIPDIWPIWQHTTLPEKSTTDQKVQDVAVKPDLRRADSEKSRSPTFFFAFIITFVCLVLIATFCTVGSRRRRASFARNIRQRRRRLGGEELRPEGDGEEEEGGEAPPLWESTVEKGDIDKNKCVGMGWNHLSVRSMCIILSFISPYALLPSHWQQRFSPCLLPLFSPPSKSPS